MEEMFQQVRMFLAAPDAQQEEFDAGSVLIWVDWGEVSYLNEVLPETDAIDYACIDTEEERGFDIILKKDGMVRAIPYALDHADRDTTLKAAQEYLAPGYGIRWYMGSLGSDKLAFIVLPTAQWRQLEQEFGIEQVAYHFAPIEADSQMFEMDVDEVFDLLEQRKQ